MQTGKCLYGKLCNFAHNSSELQVTKDKSSRIYKPCQTFHTKGYCKNGDKCSYLHNEVEGLTMDFKFNELYQYFFDKKYQITYGERLKLITIEHIFNKKGKKVKTYYNNPSKKDRLNVFKNIIKGTDTAQVHQIDGRNV